MSQKKAMPMRTINDKTDQQLLEDLKAVREELQNIRFTKVAGTSVTKISRIRVLRRTISRILTTIRKRNKDVVISKLKTKKVVQPVEKAGDKPKTVEQSIKYLRKKFLPKDLRQKKTRAIRRRLTKSQAKKVTIRQLKRKLNFPRRTYAVPQRN